MNKEIFVCDKCNCIEQIRTGYYPDYHGIILFKDDDITLSYSNLCSACTPQLDINNQDTGYKGTWHNKFRRGTWANWGFPDVLNRTKLDIRKYLTDI